MRIILQNETPNSYSITRIIQEAKKKWHTIYNAKNDDFEIVCKQKNVEIFYAWKALTKENFDVLYCRHIASKINTYKVITKYAKKNGITILDYDGIINYGEKINTYYKIYPHLSHLELITTYTNPWIHLWNKAESVLSFPQIYKPINGKEGKWIELCNNIQQVKNTIENKWEFLLQNYIPNNWDIRVLLVWDEILWGMKRTTSSKQEYRNNISLWWKATPFKIPQIREKELKKINKVLWYDISGIDLIFSEDENKRYIMEVNKWGQFEWFEKCSWINVAKHIIKHIENI